MGYHSEQIAIDARISTLEDVLEKVRLMIEEERKGMGAVTSGDIEYEIEEMLVQARKP